jgi:predicted phosphoadenosine phosphosulfate sulfurtransferase
MKIRQKKQIDIDVYTQTLDRMRYVFDTFDKVVVSFSGGKDSTAVLNTALLVAKEKNKLPLKVVFYDEEVIPPPTIEYVHRVSKNPDIDFTWFCLEVKHRNACSNDEPYWFTWDKEKKDLWVRELPEGAITEHEFFKKGMSFQEFSPYLYDRTDGRVAMLTGIRTEESIRRLRIICMKKNDAYINATCDKGSNQYRVYPIYDWSSTDVWLAVNKFGWDYNKTYDYYNKTKLFNKFLTQRVCPPFGEEPLRGLYLYAQCFPEMWHKMLGRVKGVATAWRYANTEIYSNANKKPDNMTYREYVNIILDSYDYEYNNAIKSSINKYIKGHMAKTDDMVPDDEPHILSGVSWKVLCMVAQRGDFKNRTAGRFADNSIKQLKKHKLTLEEATILYGKKTKK